MSVVPISFPSLLYHLTTKRARYPFTFGWTRVWMEKNKYSDLAWVLLLLLLLLLLLQRSQAKNSCGHLHLDNANGSLCAWPFLPHHKCSHTPTSGEAWVRTCAITTWPNLTAVVSGKGKASLWGAFSDLKKGEASANFLCFPYLGIVAYIVLILCVCVCLSVCLSFRVYIYTNKRKFCLCVRPCKGCIGSGIGRCGNWWSSMVKIILKVKPQNQILRSLMKVKG